jgi:2-(3-amino-3-carboxypropyl)histidine synthase
MKDIRWDAIQKTAQLVRSSEKKICTFGIILGTLGRQGNPAIVQRVKDVLNSNQQRHFLILLSEITPSKLRLFGTKVNVWVQVACPRLSIDWGHLLSDSVPVLSPYELFCCFDTSLWNHGDKSYPMDYYSNSGGPWANYHTNNKSRGMIQQKECCTNKEMSCDCTAG